MSLCARGLVGSALRALPRRPVRSSRDATPLGTSGGRRRARAFRGVVSAASPGDAAPASTRAVAPPWKDEVLESHSLLGNVCFVLCGPQGPQNVGSVARVMQNFGIYDLRITDPGPFVLAGGGTRDEDTTPADGASSSGGINSGAALGPDGLGSDLPEALRPTRIDSGGNPADDPASPAPPLCDEAYRFACACASSSLVNPVRSLPKSTATLPRCRTRRSRWRGELRSSSAPTSCTSGGGESLVLA